MIIIQKGQASFVFVLEMKSNNFKSAKKQLASARLCLEWLKGLLSLHNHWQGEWKFIGVISRGSRRQERKGTTARIKPSPANKLSDDFPIFQPMNASKLDLVEIAASADKWYERKL
ncbi:MAG: hypothetical protein HY692_09235 [Cyanobacteria bacterium NC_groundwater_1444_Ag_S-0.65um_54_12]|nr:hypothetical protein [Cyanobacteria bacterium NC_groundwater_1444_Ag_S-0.65um_54_12]